MLKGFWRLVERTLPEAVRRGPDVERRAQARLLGAIALLIVVLACVSAPLDAIANPTSLFVDLAYGAFGAILLLVQRRTGQIELVGTIIVLALAFLGVGLGVLFREPGDPNYGWIVVMGLAPMLSRSLLFTGAVTVVVVVLAFATATSRPDVPTVVAFGEVFPLIAAAWFTMYCVISTHRRAYAEHLAAYDAQRDIETLLHFETEQLVEQAMETADFLTRVSHELRTPLNGVLGLTDLLTHEDVSPAAAAQLARIQGAGRGVLRAFDTLLQVARATAAGGTPLEECDVPGTLDAAIHRVTHALGVSAERVPLALAPDAPRIVRIGQPVLRGAVEQLLSSVLEAGPEAVHVAATWDEARLRLVVTARLTDTDAAPLALGLPLVAELLATSGGSFDRSGTPGEDVRVAITLPCEAAEPREQGHSSATAARAERPRRRVSPGSSPHAEPGCSPT